MLRKISETQSIQLYGSKKGIADFFLPKDSSESAGWSETYAPSTVSVSRPDSAPCPVLTSFNNRRRQRPCMSTDDVFFPAVFQCDWGLHQTCCVSLGYFYVQKCCRFGVVLCFSTCLSFEGVCHLLWSIFCGKTAETTETIASSELLVQATLTSPTRMTWSTFFSQPHPIVFWLVWPNNAQDLRAGMMLPTTPATHGVTPAMLDLSWTVFCWISCDPVEPQGTNHLLYFHLLCAVRTETIWGLARQQWRGGCLPLRGFIYTLQWILSCLNRPFSIHWCIGKFDILSLS